MCHRESVEFRNVLRESSPLMGLELNSERVRPDTKSAFTCKRPKQGDPCEFQASLGYIVSSWPT